MKEKKKEKKFNKFAEAVKVNFSSYFFLWRFCQYKKNVNEK